LKKTKTGEKYNMKNNFINRILLSSKEHGTPI